MNQREPCLGVHQGVGAERGIHPGERVADIGELTAKSLMALLTRSIKSCFVTSVSSQVTTGG